MLCKARLAAEDHLRGASDRLTLRLVGDNGHG